MKRHLCPRRPSFERAEREMPRHYSILWRPCAYYCTRTLFTCCCRLQCATAMNVNYQRSPKTEQFMTAKISGNALKQRSRTHSVLRQRSSQLQKYKTAQMSRLIAVDQKACDLDGGHPGLTVSNFPNYTRIENAHEVRKKVFVFYYVAVISTITKGKKDTGEGEKRYSVSRCDQSAWNAMLVTKLKTKHILQAQVCDCISTKNETGR